MSKYEAVIGLEVHAELLTESKIFCESAAHFGGEPNTHVGPVSLGLPGTLPVLNQAVLDMAVMAGLATNCSIARRTKFDRKHYFYPDLPKGYQITQYDFPIAESGWLDIAGKRIRLNRIHMEEDAGKLVHAGAERMSGSVFSLVDYNRAGVPLLEIVSEPDIRSSAEARAYLEELRSILMTIGVCDGKMQEGSMRCDANVSIRPTGSEKFGTRVEIKNINSFKFLQKAIDYEIQRQIVTVEAGETLVQETRLWDEQRNRTLSMRSKEEAHDYRYFPDPDLVWYTLSEAQIEDCQKRLPELPAARRQRLSQAYGLSDEDVQVLVADAELCAFFEASIAAGADAQEASKWLLGDITAWLNHQEKALAESALNPEKLAELVKLLTDGSISGKIAKSILPDVMSSDASPAEIVEQKGLKQISDTGELEGMIQGILDQNPAQLEQYLAGKKQVQGFFMGQVMKQTRGQADPKVTNQLLQKALEQRRSD